MRVFVLGAVTQQSKAGSSSHRQELRSGERSYEVVGWVEEEQAQTHHLFIANLQPARLLQSGGEWNSRARSSGLGLQPRGCRFKTQPREQV